MKINFIILLMTFFSGTIEWDYWAYGKSCLVTIFEYVFLYQKPEFAINIAGNYAPGNVAYFITGLYYGFVTLVILLNLFFYATFREKKILYYSFLLLSIVVSIAHSDGLLSLIKGAEGLRYTELLAHLLVGICAAFFARQLLSLKSYRLWCTGWIFILTALVSYVMYVVTTNIYYVFLGDCTIFLSLGFYLFICLYHLHGSAAGYFLYSYLILIVVGLDFYIAKPAGFSFINASQQELKIASIIEMTTFLFLLIRRVYFLQKENRLSRIEIVDHLQEVAVPEPVQKVPEVNFDNFRSLYGLTDSEVKVFSCIAEGLSNAEISKRLFISVNTVKYHIRNIYEKLDIKSKSQAMSKIISNHG